MVVSNSGLLQSSDPDQQSAIQASVQSTKKSYYLTISTDVSELTYPADGTYESAAGETVKVEANSTEDWLFDHWLVDGQISDYSNPIEINMSGDHYLKAVFNSVEEIQVGMLGMGDVSIIPVTGAHTSGTYVQLTAEASEGWVFDHWSDAEASTANPITVSAKGKNTPTAVFRKLEPINPTYRVDVKTIGPGAGGVTLSPPGGEYPRGAIVTVTANPDPGSRFGGWSGSLDGSTNPLTLTVTGDSSLTARFERVEEEAPPMDSSGPSEYRLTIVTFGEGTVWVDPLLDTYPSGTLVTLMAIPAEGWVFAGYSGHIADTSSESYVVMDSRKTVVATFTQEAAEAVYVITASAGSHGSISPAGSISVAGGSSSAFTITPSSGYVVSDVLVDGSSVGAVSSYTFTNVQAAHTISATFTQAVYTITASAGSHGSISPAGSVTVAGGSNRGFTITPSTGYVVSDVLVDGHSVGAVSSYTFTNVQAAHTISATFAQTVYVITASAGSHGSISPSGSVSVTGGSSRAFTITPSTGYVVGDVLVDGHSVGAGSIYTFSNIQASHTIFATFTQAVYTITASAGSHGSISPSGSVSVAGGSSRVFTITPSTGYVISDVLVDGHSVGAVSSYTFSNMQAAHTISASFTSAVYVITASAGSHGSISPAGSVSVAGGSSRSFTITPSSGYVVGDVLVDGHSVGAVSSYDFTNVQAAHTISASFTSAVYVITASAGSHGSISPSGSVSVTGGSSKTFAITPSTGYVVSDVLVDGYSVGAVSSYTLSNVQAAHTISATFEVSSSSSTNEGSLKLTINHNMVDTKLTDFPIMIHLSSSSGISSTNTQSIFNAVSYNNRKQISLTTSVGAECYVEIERWDSSLRDAVLWAKIPNLSDTADTILYLNYGIGYDNTQYVGDTLDITTPKVWSNGYVGVYHLAELATGTVGEYKDSSSQRNHGTGGASVNSAVSSSKVPQRVVGPMGFCAEFDGSNDVIRIPDNPNYSVINNAGHQLTVSFWMSLDNLNINSGGWFSPVGKGDYSASVPNAKHEWKFNFYADNLGEYPDDRRQRRSFYMLDKDSGYGSGDYAQPGYNYAGDIPYWSVGSWTNICGEVNGNYVYMYNGPGILGHAGVDWSTGSGASGNIIDLQDTNAAFWLGSYGDSSSTSHYLDGRIDEVRVSNLARSVAWMKADYYSQLDDLMTYTLPG